LLDSSSGGEARVMRRQSTRHRSNLLVLRVIVRGLTMLGRSVRGTRG
jgi:hypothetical protein